MGEFKGTKGEWKVEFKYRKNTTALEVNAYSEIGGKTNLHQYILDSDDQCSAKGCSCLSKEMANAKLIAAAPEMLKTLQHIVEYWNGDRNDKAMFDALNQIIYESEEAIKKATE